MGDWPNNERLSALNIRRACDASLKRMQTDYIDLYQFHHIDRNTPFEEIWQACEVLVQQGKVLYFGSSNFAGWHIAKANETASARNFLGLVSEQSLYNLNSRTIELEVIPACREYGLGLLPWSPLDGGLLGGVLGKLEQGRRTSPENMTKLEKIKGKIERWEGLCKKVGENPADLALAWLFTNPMVTAPIVGPRTMDQLTESLRAFEISIDPEILKELDEIFPGPGGEAPEAYAW
jgi:aryl-alcohol dehydrogenase-like predicted oxidoreductase